MDASLLASSHKQAVLAPCRVARMAPSTDCQAIPWLRCFHYLMKYNYLFKKKSKLKETGEENEMSMQRNKDRSDFTLKQRPTQRCKGERKRKGWVQNASKTENAELDVRERGESTQHYHQNWLVFHLCHHFSYLVCHLVLKAPFRGSIALTSCVLQSCFCAKRTRYSSYDSISHHT